MSVNPYLYPIVIVSGAVLAIAPLVALAKGRRVVGWLGLSSAVLYSATWLLAAHYDSIGDIGAASSIFTSGQSLLGVELLVLEPIAVYFVIRPTGSGRSRGPRNPIEAGVGDRPLKGKVGSSVNQRRAMRIRF